MPDNGSDISLLPSVLDRLIDLEPDVPHEPPRNRNQTLQELKKSVLRDLRNLLNTRMRCQPWPPGLKELEKSLLSYGIPDLTGLPVGSAEEQEVLRSRVQMIIRKYERRLKNLKVRLVDVTDAPDRAVRFQIDAILQAEPAPEEVHFDSTLRLTTGLFEIEGHRNA